jgi:hypothetical protein
VPASIPDWLVNPDGDVASVLISIGLTSILLGSALLVVTTAIYFLGRNGLRSSA